MTVLRHSKVNDLLFTAVLALQLLTAVVAAGEMAMPRENEHKRDLSPSSWQPSMHLRVVEEAVQVRRQYQQEKLSSSRSSIQGIGSLKTARKLRKRHSAKNIIDRRMARCSQERLDSMLASCEAAASAKDSSSSSFFCGSGCSHEVFRFAADCNDQQFVVNVTGACKLRGNANLTVECVYAVVIVTHGITACTKMVVDVDPSHDDLSPLLDSSARKSSDYVEEACCSLQTSYESDVVHEVYVDPATGRPVTEPPLVPPWLQSSSGDYQAVVDVVGSGLCLADVATTTTATEEATTTSATVLPETSATDTMGDAATTLSSSVVSRKDVASTGSVTQSKAATSLLTQNRASLCVFVVVVLLSSLFCLSL